MVKRKKVTRKVTKRAAAPARSEVAPQGRRFDDTQKQHALVLVASGMSRVQVGLGKTIEAGVVLRELMMRQKVRRVVVACPPSVVLQWRDELERRFGLSFVVYDRDYLTQKRRERGYGVNPFTTHTRFIISHALLRDETHAVLLRDWITNDDHLRPEFREPALLVLDEAHNAAPASGGKYAIDSKFTRAVRELAPLFEHRLFLSATPHNGHLEKEQVRDLLDVIAVVDPVVTERVAKTPKLLDDIDVARLVHGSPRNYPDVPSLLADPLLLPSFDLASSSVGKLFVSAART